MALPMSFAMTKICSLNVEGIADGDVLDAVVRGVENVALWEVEREVEFAVDAGRDEDLDVGPVDGRGVVLVGLEVPEADDERDSWK